uniref:Uncharacterized protein n=1 Tax=Micrurus lemniscatus lemniscatus TaxID=129467 RepID=A0A2D4I0G5_MICLE
MFKWSGVVIFLPRHFMLPGVCGYFPCTYPILAASQVQLKKETRSYLLSIFQPTIYLSLNAQKMNFKQIRKSQPVFPAITFSGEQGQTLNLTPFQHSLWCY